MSGFSLNMFKFGVFFFGIGYDNLNCFIKKRVQNNSIKTINTFPMGIVCFKFLY